jgi:hypothetical protein
MSMADTASSVNPSQRLQSPEGESEPQAGRAEATCGGPQSPASWFRAKEHEVCNEI